MSIRWFSQGAKMGNLRTYNTKIYPILSKIYACFPLRFPLPISPDYFSFPFLLIIFLLHFSFLSLLHFSFLSLLQNSFYLFFYNILPNPHPSESPSLKFPLKVHPQKPFSWSILMVHSKNILKKLQNSTLIAPL